MAQVWGHPIAPLLNAARSTHADSLGADRFPPPLRPRAPTGMWLPETAANEATLAALIDAGIAYTILAPEQIEAVRPGADEEWQPVTTDTVDTGRAYRCLHPDGSGRSLALAIFDGPLSRDLAFGTATRDAASFLAAMRRSAERSKVTGRRLVLAASDGELYGHHKKFADLTLAYALSVAAPAEHIEVTNLGAFLARVARRPGKPACARAPTARARPGAAATGSAAGGATAAAACTTARARARPGAGPCAQALDHLRDRAAIFFEDAGRRSVRRSLAGPRRLRRRRRPAPQRRAQLLRRLGRPALRATAGRPVAQRLVPHGDAALAAAHVRELRLVLRRHRRSRGRDRPAPRRARDGPVEAARRQAPARSFTAILAQARSNHPELGTGARRLRPRLPGPRLARAGGGACRLFVHGFVIGGWWRRHTRLRGQARLPSHEARAPHAGRPGAASWRYGPARLPRWTSLPRTTAWRNSTAGWMDGAWVSTI